MGGKKAPLVEEETPSVQSTRLSAPPPSAYEVNRLYDVELAFQKTEDRVNACVPTTCVRWLRNPFIQPFNPSPPPPLVRPPALKNTHPFIGSCSTYWGHCCRKPNTRNCTITHAPMLAPRRGHGVFPFFRGSPHIAASLCGPHTSCPTHPARATPTMSFLFHAALATPCSR